MPKKSLNIKIPMSVASKMDDRGQLNPEYIENFIKTYIRGFDGGEFVNEFSIPQTIKVEPFIHRLVKQSALDNNLSMNELVCRLLAKYY